ncbi:unnamed protein product [Periconia digitata]|uniref:Ferric oxidoreductase domain-containing protein n=1 Tax=Periconia digitata TaxID=1303443 RepID=A0A9W4XQR3_9PLEO|nr:unnamed protein product [Periconia digitata]
MMLTQILPLLLFLSGTASAWQAGRSRQGFVGFSFYLYDPVCAGACQGVFRKSPMYCTDKASFKGSSTGHGGGSTHTGSTDIPNNYTLTPSPLCLSQNRDFLTSQAWCLHQKCAVWPDWKLEKWWWNYVVGNLASDPRPSLSYGAALALVSKPPTYSCAKAAVMNQTCLPDEKVYKSRFISIDVNQEAEILHQNLAMVVFLTSVGLPVALSLLRFLPFPSNRVASALSARFVYPSLPNSWSNSPIATVVGDPPTRGQALFIAYLIVINVVLSAVGLKSAPDSYPFFWKNGPDMIKGLLANRMGLLAFANYVVLILFSSRNNVLLWITNWEPSTFVLLHRWVGRIAILQTILHSIVFLNGWLISGLLKTDQTLPYWWWGCIGTIASSLMLPLSIPVLRKRVYELFLVSHVFLSILTLLGSWYHIYFKYQHNSGYETWLYIAFALWGFDRLGRLLRMLRYGVRTAHVTEVDDEYIRINVKGVVATGHVYLYFLHSRFWENHPFSVASSTIHTQPNEQAYSDRTESPTAVNDHEETRAAESKQMKMYTAHNHSTTEPGMVFYLRVLDGATKALLRRSQVKVLIEGPYGRLHDLSEFPTLICIAGGVGITGCLPYLNAHPGSASLYWGVRTQALADSIKPLIQPFHHEVAVAQRLDLEGILGGVNGDFAVVVSGPSGMEEEVRRIASRLGRTRRVQFVSESFTL